ncbi:hypothetical protein NL676_026410 [Syzygium grande]|nr:hypothetical protein NL676_026410 [Syzygium grande]
MEDESFQSDCDELVNGPLLLLLEWRRSRHQPIRVPTLKKCRLLLATAGTLSSSGPHARNRVNVNVRLCAAGWYGARAGAGAAVIRVRKPYVNTKIGGNDERWPVRL